MIIEINNIEEAGTRLILLLHEAFLNLRPIQKDISMEAAV